ncbi:LON peptidase substrate-binding domain-containing protein [Catenovulum sp. SM1970]|uniref:LON peptidase substrate-binding domain-containing protein n=1 Tax=Marinifaba aquimaris TaxID=2741323 RepID=UPI001571A4D4|nr:LON peptidase substrate-binding domain-containing protein [Marinifaba aquimaris]NTS76481.1 LON peptidase substrate-binding domain-containing protein [Marinifaba aquimaris]
MMQLAIFPLPIFLLPNGVTRLRIFEQRYIRMVKEAVQGDGFALSLYQEDNEFGTSGWATWVKIIDFETLPDGLLSIDIQGQSMMKIDEVWYEEDKLRRGNLSLIPHWSPEVHSEDTLDICDELKRVFEHNPQYSELYREPHFESATWVCQRWLEILPIENQEKAQFIQPNSFNQAKHFLNNIILG